ncbi:MAG: hypothetical protein ACT4PQ_10925 [Betaproteobacteria bacterium]
MTEKNLNGADGDIEASGPFIDENCKPYVLSPIHVFLHFTFAFPLHLCAFAVHALCDQSWQKALTSQ